jgi:hypothetical protein
MKTFAGHAVALLAITVACHAGLALAEDGYYEVSGSNPSTAQAVGDKAPGLVQSGCNSCCPDQSCGTCNPCGGCTDCGCDSRFGVVGAFGLDAFKGVSDLNRANFGAVTSVKSGILLPGVEDFGLGWQTGVSYGVYDFDGRLAGSDVTAHAQQQTFVTTGFYRKATGDQRVSFGVVYDWMINTGWGFYGVNNTLGQWRGQVEYAVNDTNGLGVWGTKDDLGSERVLDGPFSNTIVNNRAISQVNLFWHHKFVDSGADSCLWTGLSADRERLDQSVLTGGGTLGDWIIGASIQVALSERLALYANGSYMHPTSAAGPSNGILPMASYEASYDVSIGVAWYFGCHARSCSLQGKRFLPYMPLANNSNFLVDQSPGPLYYF